MKKQLLAIILLLTISASSFASIHSGNFLGLNKTTSVDYYVPENALFVGDPYQEPDYLYTVAKSTYTNRYTNFSYNLAMGIHDVNDNGQKDTWYIGENNYGATAGSIDGGLANWNIDVYVNPVILGIEELSGTISYSTSADSSALWSEAIDFWVSGDATGTEDVLGKCKWFQTTDAAGTQNADLVFGTKSYKPKEEGYYTITLDYGFQYFGVSNTIVVEVGEAATSKGANPFPIVPAPGAVLLSGFGTIIAGRIRRR